METRTRTNTLSYTYIDVRHVNWKIRSDLRYLRFLYGLFSEFYEEEMSGDLYKWVLAGYVSNIRFVFYTPLGYELQLGIRYTISSFGTVSKDDDAGSIPYINLPSGTRFDAIVGTNDAWRSLSDQEKNDFYATLGPGWGASQLNLKDSSSMWNSDKTYSSNSLSAQREIYKIT